MDVLACLNESPSEDVFVLLEHAFKLFHFIWCKEGVGIHNSVNVA